MKSYWTRFMKIIDILAIKLRFIKIKSRLIISFAVILLVPIIAMSIYSLNYSSKAIKAKVSAFSSIEMSQISKNIQNQLDYYKSGILTITANQDFSDNLSNFNDLGQVEKTNFINLLQNSSLKKLMVDKNVSSVAIITEEGKLVAGKGYEAGLAEKIIKAKDNRGGGVSIKTIDTSTDTSKHVYEICFSREIVDISTGGKIGYIWINVNEDSFYSIYKNNIKGNDGQLMIMDSKGTVVSSNNKEQVGVAFKDTNLIRFVTTSKISDSLKVSNKNYFVTSSVVDNYDWFLVSMITNSYLNQEASVIKVSIICIAIVIFLIALIISLLISNSISSPLKRLMNSIEEAKDGRIKPGESDSSKDEVGEVTKSFNEMMLTLSTLLGNTKENSQNILNSIEAITQVAKQSYSASEEIAVTMNEVAKGAGEQAEGMANTVNYLDNLTEGINKVELSLKETLEVIDDTEALTKETKTAIKFLEEKSKDTSTVSRRVSINISELNSYMDEIHAITKLLVGVSQQTNLLALNASIEAARAGEAGIGFTIVANEVRKLAEQTNTASIKIAKIIDQLTGKITYITDNVKKSQRVIIKQHEAIKETNSSVSSISLSMTEVIYGIGEIINSVKVIQRLKEETSNSIEGISAVSQETAAITEQVTATTNEQITDMENLSGASNILKGMIVKLNSNMEMFKV